MRGTRLESLPPPRPPAGSHLSWQPDAWRPGPCGSVGHGRAYPLAWAPFPCGSERPGDRAPAPRTSFLPAACGPAAGHTCQLERLQPGRPRKVPG